MTPGGRLRAELLARFRRGVDHPFDASAFNELALAAFSMQFEADDTYRAYCGRRGVEPATVEDWRRIPAVPARAFKDLVFASGPRGARSAVFATSGTGAGPARRGRHHVPDLDLYDASAAATLRHFLLPDVDACRVLSLIPPPDELPDSSLSYMAGLAHERFGAAGSGWFMSSSGGLASRRLAVALEDARAAAEPVCLLGTSLAFAAWLEELGAAGTRFRLPDGSRLMDTGGAKGRKRALDAAALRSGYAAALGIPDYRCVNEYGMTELCSQYYDRCLRRGVREPRDLKASAPWLACVAADPDTLEPLPEGAIGVLRHVDLANLGSVVAVQTEDRGRVVDGAVELLGRTPGAEPRGCSLALELMLQQADAAERRGV
jgi:hypothetical protein